MDVLELESQPTTALADLMVPSTPPSKAMYASHCAEMTPPPSTQPLRPIFDDTGSKSPQRSLFLQSPPSTVRFGAELPIPSQDDIATANQDELRTIAQDLALAVAQARMSAAHFKLQHRLLMIQCQESAQRAEVEQQMTRREVEVLRSAGHHRPMLSINPPTNAPNSQSPAQSQIDALLRTCKDLEEERDEAEHRLGKAKKIIEQQIDRADLLYEENIMLKKRIRENRKHFTLFRQSPAFSTPRTEFSTPQRTLASIFTEPGRSLLNNRDQDPLAALLAADQVLNGEVASLPSTPTRSQSTKFHQGHTRGALSLPSLQIAPGHSRPVTSGNLGPTNKGHSSHWLTYPTPKAPLQRSHQEIDRRDRDSTISVSDEEALTDEDLPPSQASSLATNMLRRNPGNQESFRFPGKAEKSSKVLQTKLFGQAKRTTMDRKRPTSFCEGDVAKKKRLAEGVGLGIEAWSPSNIR